MQHLQSAEWALDMLLLLSEVCSLEAVQSLSLNVLASTSILMKYVAFFYF